MPGGTTPEPRYRLVKAQEDDDTLDMEWCWSILDTKTGHVALFESYRPDDSDFESRREETLRDLENLNTGVTHYHNWYWCKGHEVIYQEL